MVLLASSQAPIALHVTGSNGLLGLASILYTVSSADNCIPANVAIWSLLRRRRRRRPVFQYNIIL